MKINTNIKILGALAIGIIVTKLYYDKKNKVEVISSPNPTIKKGDFGKEVEKLQELINRFFGTNVVDVTGAYDKKTSECVKIIFYNTPELVNVEQGELTVKSISLLNQILDNIQTKKDE